MAKALRALIKWYRTGENADRVAYDIAWVQDKSSPVDTINGFIEVYMDPRGQKGSWEALVFYVNPAKTEGIRKLAADAFRERLRIDHHVERLPVALPDVDRLRIRHQPAHDHLPVAHVIFFDLRALADPAQLHQRVARVTLVFGLNNLPLILCVDDAELGEPRIRDEVQGHQIRS